VEEKRRSKIRDLNGAKIVNVDHFQVTQLKHKVYICEEIVAYSSTNRKEKGNENAPST